MRTTPDAVSEKILREMGSLRWTIIILIGMMANLAYATYIESQEGHAAAMVGVIHWWVMDLLIFAFAVNLITCTILKAPYRLDQIPWLITHIGILITMGGAIVSHRTVLEGQILLRTGQPVDAASLYSNSQAPMEVDLGFQLELDSFSVEYYPGTGKASNYVSYIRVLDPTTDQQDTIAIRVNHPLIKNGWNISQASFIPGDNNATILGANKDPGTTIIYVGFIAVTLGLFGLFFLKSWLKKLSGNKKE